MTDSPWAIPGAGACDPLGDPFLTLLCPWRDSTPPSSLGPCGVQLRSPYENAGPRTFFPTETEGLILQTELSQLRTHAIQSDAALTGYAALPGTPANNAKTTNMGASMLCTAAF
jgi:hypothetical protein